MRSIIARRPKNRIADARTFTASTLAVATASKALSSLSKLCASIKTSSMPSLCALAATWATEGLVFDSARAATRRAIGTISMRSSSRFSSSSEPNMLTPVTLLPGRAILAAQQVYPVPFDPERVPSARAILERRTVVIPDATAPDVPEFTRKVRAAGGVRSIAYVPLVNQDKGIGTIILAHPQPGFELTRKQIEVLETFADQAVIAIENTRLFEEVQARTRELTESLEYQTATSEVLNIVSRSPSDLQNVLDAIVATAMKLCDSFDASIFLKEGDRLRVGAHHSDLPLGVESMPLGRGWATGRAPQGGPPILGKAGRTNRVLRRPSRYRHREHAPIRRGSGT